MKHFWGHHRFDKRRFSPLQIVGMVLGGITLAVIFATLFGWLFMLLWNAVMPEVFNLNQINYWQAIGIVLLAKILFGAHGHSGHRHPRDRSEYREFTGNVKGASRENLKDFWETEGKEAFERYVDKKKKEND